MNAHSQPSDPRFSCGPTRKFAKWSPSKLDSAPVGRYHRSDIGKALLADVYDMTRDALSVPNDYHLLTLPGSCTGAITAIMANTFAERPIKAYSQGVFGDTWANDAKLFAYDIEHRHAFCALPDFNNYCANADTLLVMNETTVGAKIPDLNWIHSHRAGLTICDVTSSAFVNPIDWSKTDIAIWSWQKALAGEAGFATVALSPRAVERILGNTRPQPKLFTLKKDDKLIELVNTLSLFALQDVHFSLSYYLKQGGQESYYQACMRKREFVNDWLTTSANFTDYVENKNVRSDTVVYLKANDDISLKTLPLQLALNDIAYDIGSHRATPKGIRFWIGPSIPYEDVVALCSQLEFRANQHATA